MRPISSLILHAAQPSISAADVKDPQKVQQPEDGSQERPLKPVMDEYIPEEEQRPTGRYWLAKDEDGRPKIYFDDLEQDQDAKGTDKKDAGDKKVGSCTCNTDKVDREIEKLKKKRAELEQQLNSETDDTKVKNLEKELAQVERELRQKDNDTYRRQHAVYTYT